MAGCTHCHVSDADTLRRDSRFRRALWIALVLNGGMFGVELVASLLGRSVSLQADALDFLGDSWTYAISLAVIGMGLRARATAALAKGATMGLFGLWVVGSTAWQAWAGTVPSAEIMGPVAIAALAANVSVAVLLFRYRGGDANMRSIWLCSRNDVIANLAVLAAAAAVAVTGAGWPDIVVAAAIAALSLSSAASIIRQALHELGHPLPGAIGS